jgi:BirA family transcriptional regulator, biotin operon repressor / biotin---[acetyl-CoA-carboxylase] ligase
MSARVPAASDVPADFRDALSRHANRLCGFGSPLSWYESVPSTNDLADRAAVAGAAHGTVVAAECQESGRGRLGRTWFSPPGAGLYVSVVVRPGDLGGVVSAAASLTLTAGVALAEAIRRSTGLDAAIKWPNDLVVGSRKVCGILAEGAAGSSGLQHVVLGYGINVLSAAYPPEIADRATSIESELGRPVDRSAVFAESLACLAEHLRELSAGGFAAILDRWRALSPSSVGREVDVASGSGRVGATTAGIDDDGALLVSAGGTTRRVIAGEVRWR